MRNFNFNICCLFDCESYYEISGDNEAWVAYTREPDIGFGFINNVDFRACLNRAIEHRDQAKSQDPIIVWADNDDDKPFFALLGSGEIKTFEDGSYLAPLKDNVLTNILKGYISGAENDSDDYSCNFEEIDRDLRKNHNKNLLCVFGVDGYYELSTIHNLAHIHKDVFNEVSLFANVKSLKRAIGIVIQERAKAGTKYPIFIKEDYKPSNRNKEPIVITHTLELKSYKKGFFDTPWSGTLEQATSSILAYKAEKLLNG